MAIWDDLSIAVARLALGQAGRTPILPVTVQP
jgi:hypothetical protein